MEDVFGCHNQYALFEIERLVLFCEGPVSLFITLPHRYKWAQNVPNYQLSGLPIDLFHQWLHAIHSAVDVIKPFPSRLYGPSVPIIQFT